MLSEPHSRIQIAPSPPQPRMNQQRYWKTAAERNYRMCSQQRHDNGSCFGSKHVRSSLFALFLISLFLDVEILLTPLLIRLRILHPNGWSALAFSLEVIVQIVVMGGATILWLLMLYHVWAVSGRSIFSRLLWGVLFFFGAWFTSQIYYAFSFRRCDIAGGQLKRFA